MVSLLVHAILGIAVIAFIVKSNPAIFRRVPAARNCRRWRSSSGSSASRRCPSCWYFNIRYVQEYAQNPIIGQPNWSEFIALGYANPASSSQVADYTIINVILLPLFTDRRRPAARHQAARGCTSCQPVHQFAFAWAFYLATVERQRRHKLAASRSIAWPDARRGRRTVGG